MLYRSLGNTGLNVSKLSVGTVSLGTNYGIGVPNDFGQPTEAEAVRILQQAADDGINLFDTASGNGDSERRVGLALGKRTDCIIATKITVPVDEGKFLHGNPLRQAVKQSLVKSLKELQRDVLDIVQIHNATIEQIDAGEIVNILLEAKKEGLIRYVGASVYGTETALKAIKNGSFNMIQIAYNILDQRMASEVFLAANQNGVGVLCRSVYLKGVLTAKAKWLPSELAALQQAAEKVKNNLAESWEDLPQVALRFCLFNNYISSVLVGVRTVQEVKEAISALERGALSEANLALAEKMVMENDELLNPSRWPSLV